MHVNLEAAEQLITDGADIDAGDRVSMRGGPGAVPWKDVH